MVSSQVILVVVLVLVFFAAIGFIVKWVENSANKEPQEELSEWWTKDNPPVKNSEIEQSFDDGVQEHLDKMEEERKAADKLQKEKAKSSIRNDLGSVTKRKPITVAKSSPRREYDNHIYNNAILDDNLFDIGSSSSSFSGNSSSCSSSGSGFSSGSSSYDSGSSSYDSGSSSSFSSSDSGSSCF
jgi:hypothetical protein